ncbi:MAG: hypothetical protein VW582_08040 [Rhodospirillaceae bacterium]
MITDWAKLDAISASSGLIAARARKLLDAAADEILARAEQDRELADGLGNILEVPHSPRRRGRESRHGAQRGEKAAPLKPSYLPLDVHAPEAITTAGLAPITKSSIG